MSPTITATINRKLHTPDALHEWIQTYAHLCIPRQSICPGHDAPFEYIKSAYFEPAHDLIVWAPRGGGKTCLGALATLLDLLHKSNCNIRILGGSLDQSLRMWEHLYPMLLENAADQIVGRARTRIARMKNRSTAAVLTQSQRAVRGLRVQKLRCDEVELFDPQIWQAAQLVTKSTNPQLATNNQQLATSATGTIEALSTLHTPFGLMHRIIENAQRTKTRIIRWCLLEVLEHCPQDRDCATCPLWEDCKGIAKTKCNGFISIDDAIAMKQRVSLEQWQCEMLCQRPSQRHAVFPTFNPEVHVKDESQPATNNQQLATTSLAIDFGFASPFVCLWIERSGSGSGSITHVLDEYVQPARLLEEHIEQIRTRQWAARIVCCDPAGNARNDQTSVSNVSMLRKAGFVVRTRGSGIVDGLEMIRTALAPAAGRPRLSVHPRCVRLIKALQSYRYAEGGSELPVKDGEHDHLIDPLRYHFVNWSVNTAVTIRAY